MRNRYRPNELELFVKKIDENKSCYNCKHYIEGFESYRPGEPTEYDGDHCTFHNWMGSRSDDHIGNLERFIGALDETFRMDDYDGTGNIFVANVCPFYNHRRWKRRKIDLYGFNKYSLKDKLNIQYFKIFPKYCPDCNSKMKYNPMFGGHVCKNCFKWLKPEKEGNNGF